MGEINSVYVPLDDDFILVE